MKQTKLNVLFVEVGLYARGAERVALDVMRHLDREQIEPRLWVLKQEGELWDEVPSDVPVMVAVKAGGRLRNKLPQSLFSLLRAAREADVLVGAIERQPTYLTYVAGLVLRKPVVAWVHNSMSHVFDLAPWWDRSLSRLIYPRVTHIVFPSQGTRETLEGLFPLPAGRLSVIHNPLNFDRLEAQRAIPLPDWAGAVFARPTVIGVGRLNGQKGFDLLIQAHALLRRRGTDHHLLILGEGEDRRSLEMLARSLGVEESVFLPGHVSNPYPLMARADVFALSSRFEGLPGVLIEALACGTPVVSTRCPSGPEGILQGGQAGLLVPTEDVEGLATGMGQLLEQPQLAEQLSVAGQRRAGDFRPRHVVPEWSELLLRLRRDPVSAARS